VDNTWHISTAAGATKCRTLPHATRHQLEWASRDFRTGFGHANDDGLSPAAVAAFQGFAHDLGVTDALEGIVRAAVSQLDDVIHNVFDIIRVDEVRHTKLASHGFTLRVDIHANDFVGTHHFGALNHVQADTAQAEHHHISARFHVSGVEHRTQTGGH